MEPEYLIINTRDELIRIDTSTIVYLEAEGNYTHIVLQNGTRCTLCMNLTRMQALLGERLQSKAVTLARVGKSYIVNLGHVYLISILRQRLYLSDGRTFSYTLSISKEALRQLRTLFIPSSTHAPSLPTPNRI